jgi:glycogen(starch) synthase
MRILVVNLEFPPVGGGGANATWYLVRELVKRGHAVDVLTSQFKGLPKREMVNGATVIRIPVRRARLDQCSVKEMMTFALSAIPYAVSLASKNRYDVTHVFFGIPCGHIGWLLRRTHRLPYLISLRGGDVPGFKPYGYDSHYRRVRPFVRYLWDDANALVSVSEGLREHAITVHPQVQDIMVIPNGVDTDEFRPRPTPHPGPVTILCVARLIRRKGIDYLIDAAALLRERTTTPFQIVVVGDGYHRSGLEQHVAKEGLDAYFTFRGGVPHQELPPLYQAADVFCLPSLAEGMANVLLEALASGLPLIATKTSGSLEIVHPHRNGMLVNQADAADLAEKLLMVIENPALRQQFGSESRRRAALFSWPRIAELYEGVYQRITRP